jgi:hypothetical protein
MAHGRTHPATEQATVESLRDRVVDFRRVPSAELQDNAANWRTHPYAQQAAIGELLDQVGIAGALTAYHSERNGGALTLIDGHERRGHQADWPTIILDVTDEEADLLLLALDPIAGMATASADELNALLSTTHPGTVALEDLLLELGRQGDEPFGGQTPGLTSTDDPTPAMGLNHFEHYDYVVVLAKNSHDWLMLQDLLGIEQVEFRLSDGRRQFGLGRVIDASALLARLRPEE